MKIYGKRPQFISKHYIYIHEQFSCEKSDMVKERKLVNLTLGLVICINDRIQLMSTIGF